MKGSFKGDIDIDRDIDVDVIDSCLGRFKGVSKSVQVPEPIRTPPQQAASVGDGAGLVEDHGADLAGDWNPHAFPPRPKGGSKK